MAPAFAIQASHGGLATLLFDLPDKKVNVFTRDVLTELGDVIESLSARRDLRCLVLLSGKSGNFIAGADIDEIAGVSDPVAAEEGVRLGQHLFQAWSELPFPTVAAVRGTCVGGGTELCLASDYIIVSDREDTRIGLPEVRIGIVPAWGGCSRLPRRIGLAAALDIILAGKSVDGRKAHAIGLADALLPDAAFLHEVRDFAERIIEGRAPRRRHRGLRSTLLEGNPIGRNIVLSQARKRLMEGTAGHYPAPLRAVEVVEVGLRRGLEEGQRAEVRAAAELAVSPVCKNLLHVFRIMEDRKHEVADIESAVRPMSRAAVLGAGVMGGGIAQLVAQEAKIPVDLKDVGVAPLAAGMGHADRRFQELVERRRLTRPQAAERMNLLRPCLDYSGFEAVDLVIEAIVEDLEIKRQVLAEVAGHVRPETILATNTSSLSVELVARGTPNPDRVVGMHFFNPVHRMPLVEVIEGRNTSAEAVQAVVAFCSRLGKVPVVIQDSPGFLVNRILMLYIGEALWLLNEGHSIAEIDQAMTDWGMPLGPLALIDTVGLDVAAKVAQILARTFPDRLALPPWVDNLAVADRLGVKTGLGFYSYDGPQRSKPDQEVYELLGLARAKKGLEPSRLVERMVLPMVNEAARCLEERLVGSPSDLDLAMILGAGFPPFRGGLCRWADSQGLEQLGASLEELAAGTGARFAPAAGLARAIQGGGLYPTYG